MYGTGASCFAFDPERQWSIYVYRYSFASWSTGEPHGDRVYRSGCIRAVADCSSNSKRTRSSN